nr:hypothetical protein [Streptomyces sp. RFCAC02]
MHDVEQATDELRDALALHGLTFPSLGVDPVTYAGLYPLPLVELGRCPVHVAVRLTEVLRKAAAR